MSFIFACLYPFLNKLLLEDIFGENIFGKINLIPLMEELIGERLQPFECVGTKKESLIAFIYAGKRVSKDESPVLFWGISRKKILPNYSKLEKETKKIMNSWNKRNNLPKEFKKYWKTRFWQKISILYNKLKED